MAAARPTPNLASAEWRRERRSRSAMDHRRHWSRMAGSSTLRGPSLAEECRPPPGGPIIEREHLRLITSHEAHDWPPGPRIGKTDLFDDLVELRFGGRSGDGVEPVPRGELVAKRSLDRADHGDRC